MASKEWHDFIAMVLRLVRDFIDQFRTQETILFRFTESHSKAPLAVAFIVVSALVGPIFYKDFGWAVHAGLVGAFVIGLGIAAVLISGLRTSIVVTPTRTTITKRWLLIPYWHWSARAIDDVSYGGDWGKPHYAAGVVLLLGAKEIHIGSGKSMHALYSALLPLSNSSNNPKPAGTVPA